MNRMWTTGPIFKINLHDSLNHLLIYYVGVVKPIFNIFFNKVFVSPWTVCEQLVPFLILIYMIHQIIY